MAKIIASLALVSLFAILPSLTVAQPRPMTEDVFTPLDKGYVFMKMGKYQAAQEQFHIALKRDRYNPFALNNLAAIAAQEGKLRDAMAYLTDANTFAKDYHQQYAEICFTAGLWRVVKPLKKLGTESTIEKVIAENMKKLKKRISMSDEPIGPRIKTTTEKPD